MRSIKRVVVLLILLVVGLGCLTFVLENQQNVSLAFLGWATPDMPISIFLGLTLIVGMLIGPFLGLLAARGRAARRKARYRQPVSPDSAQG